MQYKAIISGIDGTLIPLIIDALPSERVREAIRKAEDKGVLLCLATGKPYSLIENLISNLIPTSLLITEQQYTIQAHTK